MSILVTGASGRLGRLTAEALLALVPASEIILGTRTPEALGSLAAAGVAVRHCDFAEPSSLAGAFQGVSRALVVSGMPPGDIVGKHRAAFEAAGRAGVSQLVYTSFPNPVADNPAPPAGYQRLSEEALMSVGVPWTILRNAFYAELRTDIAPRYVAAGVWTTNVGSGAHAFVSRRDCAAAAAGALASSGHEGKIYDVTGPELVSAEAYTRLLEHYAGRPILCRQVSDEAFESYRAEFEADPDNASSVELYGGSGKAIREGWLNQQSDAVRVLSGRQPCTLTDVLVAKTT